MVDEELELKWQFRRTMAVLTDLFAGQQVTLADGHRIGMGIDLTVGFILTHADGSETVGGLEDLSLKQLNQLLERAGIGFPLPNSR